MSDRLDLSAKRPLSRRLITALDVVRVLAAVIVVLQHLGPERAWFAGPLTRFGQEAVIVFFLLSGFVIFANEYYRLHDLRGYYLRRIRRIYPTLICALVVTTLVAGADGTLHDDFSVAQLLGNLFALQDVSFLKPGVIVDPYLHNDPLWSLSYELFFYLIFPGVFALWRRAPGRTNIGLIVVCCLCYAIYAAAPAHLPRIMSYFLVWWAGAMAARAYLEGARSWMGCRDVVAGLGLLSLTALVVTAVQGFRGLGFYPFLPARHFIVALVFVLVFFGPFGRWLLRIPAGRLPELRVLRCLSFPLSRHGPLVRGPAVGPGPAPGAGPDAWPGLAGGPQAQ